MLPPEQYIMVPPLQLLAISMAVKTPHGRDYPLLVEARRMVILAFHNRNVWGLEFPPLRKRELLIEFYTCS